MHDARIKWSEQRNRRKTQQHTFNLHNSFAQYSISFLFSIIFIFFLFFVLISHFHLRFYFYFASTWTTNWKKRNKNKNRRIFTYQLMIMCKMVKLSVLISFHSLIWFDLLLLLLLLFIIIVAAFSFVVCLFDLFLFIQKIFHSTQFLFTFTLRCISNEFRFWFR